MPVLSLMLLRERKADAGVAPGVVLQDAVEVPELLGAEARPPVANPGIGEPLIRDRRHPRDRIDALDEAQLIAEVGRQGVLNRRPVEMPAVLSNAHFRRQARSANRRVRPGPICRSDSRIAGLADAEREVRPQQPAVVVHELAVGEDHADVRVAVEVVLDAPEDVLRRLPWSGIGVVHFARRFVVGQEQPDRRPASDLAGQLGAVARIDDPARLHRLRPPRDLVNFPSLEEERTQFRIVDREALVDVDLLRFRFDLREVGVVGEVERQVRVDAVLETDAAFLRGCRSCTRQSSGS